jgi:hypothetical protein
MDEARHKKNFKPIVLRDLFMDKNPRLARWIPGFVFRLLSKILRIDFMNDPIAWTTFDDRFSSIEWAQLVKEHVYDLEKNTDAPFAYLK